MKKITTVLLVLSLLLAISGCSNDSDYEMSIKPSEFSEETLSVLELFNDELFFYDLKIDETAVSQRISIWLYVDGVWDEAGAIYGEADFENNQLALMLTDQSFEIFTINENGHSSYSYPAIDTNFEDSQTTTSAMIDSETPIELNQETTLWVKLGTNNNSISVGELNSDFRNSNCNAGAAITITVSDQPIE